MNNESADNPEGVLNKDVLKSFMSISGPDNDLVWTPGNERFPDVFYKRNDADQYSIPCKRQIPRSSVAFRKCSMLTRAEQTSKLTSFTSHKLTQRS